MSQRYPTRTKATAAVQDAGPAPQPIQNAAKLMYAGAALTGVLLIVTVATIGSVKTAIHKADPSWTSSHVSSAATSWVIANAIGDLIGIGLWILMAQTNQQGRSWARVVASVLFALNTLFGIEYLRGGASGLGVAANGLVWLAGLGAIILLWLPASTEFFNRNRAAA